MEKYDLNKITEEELKRMSGSANFIIVGDPYKITEEELKRMSGSADAKYIKPSEPF